MGLLGISTLLFAPTINHRPLSDSHNWLSFPFSGERSGRRMPPADRPLARLALYLTDENTVDDLFGTD